ncbi:oxygen-insensitive NADPH nitroreductase [Schinkia azotoformans]|uniref:oxygen-insensitive NADPH nitroreductase n=1 Tax=Schinkia azotoformans TaxID=1454 RepID=UPI002DBB88FE|nr:oxygen-insensitive NADPH nitroreductase [Schinkia azotoformans]MEC1722642.1 oxygen-insensitive NADPH nitroreductase [Schinkia azotoformans]MED4415403.1 oxygen-insensitive NADPH nitroreductase [Schinkia azotoformans]
MTKQNSLSEIVNLMRNHVSVRRYTTDVIPKEHLLEIIRAAQGAPSSHFVQAYSIIHVTDQEKKNKIAELTGNQKQVSDCSDFLLFCGDLKRLEYACKKHGIAIEHDTLENFMVAVIDTALISQNVITAAESLGYGGCYVGGVRNNPGQISELVRLPDKVFPLFGLCLGVPAKRNEVKPRLPLEAIIHENEYNEEKYLTILDEYDQIMNDYYKARTSNNKETNWTKTMADFMKEKRRLHMREFIERKGFSLE